MVMYVKKYASLLVVVLVGCITYLQYTTIAPVRTLHNILREPYYIPLFIGALTYGLAALCCRTC